MWQTIGHKNQKLFLENALKTDKISHAYLFAGPSEVGKRTLALEFANKILGSEISASTNAKMNPDLILQTKEQNKIEDIRNLIHELSMKPYSHQYKVAIIDDFENITEEAANSILKTLEEPNPSTIIILIAQNKKHLLPTVLSRCQVLDFNRLEPKELGAEKLAHLFNGKIGKKIRFDQDKDFQEQLIAQSVELQEIKKQSIAGRLLAIKNYAEMESAELQEVFENWLDQEHYQFIRTTPQKFKNPSLLVEAISGLHQNFNKKLVLEKLFLNLA